jgi:tyrosyl-tRNA synthetase
MTVIELAMKLNHFKNLEEANRIIKGGGFKINSVTTTDPAEALIFGQHILTNNITVVRVGK